MKLLWELVRKDLRIFVADRRSALISFVTPVLLACFIGFLYSSTSKSNQPKSVSILIVDQDHSVFSKDLMDRMRKGGSLDIKETDEASAKKKVSGGDVGVAVVIPNGFGVAAAQAMIAHTEAPQLRLFTDPSKAMEVGLAQGAIYRVTMQAVSKQAFGDAARTDDSQLPFKVKNEVQATSGGENAGLSAHAFAGMAMQGLLFWAIESAMTLLRERKMGIWRRLRSSPVTPSMFLLGKAISSMIRALAIIVAVFGVGFVVFKFQITPTAGNYIGFGLIAIAASLMSATFGLFVAALGRNENQSRGLSVLAVLGMCMLGGAWFPMFLMPQFLQDISKVVPISWAVNGFDGMIWRGQGIQEAVVASAVLTGFAAIFGLVALRRIKWDPEAG